MLKMIMILFSSLQGKEKIHLRKMRISSIDMEASDNNKNNNNNLEIGLYKTQSDNYSREYFIS